MSVAFCLWLDAKVVRKCLANLQLKALIEILTPTERTCQSRLALQEASSENKRFPLECYNNAAILKLAKRTSQRIYTLANTIKSENEISRTKIQKNNLSSTMAKCLHSS